MLFEIEKEIFTHFPGLRIVTARVEGLSNECDETGIDAFLKEAWASAGAAATEYGNPQSHPFIKPWVESMKAVGVSRKKFPVSIESMVRRASKSDSPFSINPIVDFYNAISLKNIVPAGGYDTAEFKDHMTLRMSREGDTFCALDSDETESIPPGEVSYADCSEIITRHFLWKQSRHCLLTENTKDILFVSEIEGSLPEEIADTVAADFRDGLKKFFNTDAEVIILNEKNPGV